MPCVLQQLLYISAVTAGNSPNDEELLNQIQRAAFGYFLQAMDPVTGLVADTSRTNSPCSIAVVGFALSVLPIGVERGWITRENAVAQCLLTLRFFHDSDQSGTARSTGYKGFYFHFLDMRTGARVWQCELSMIDTALLIAGVLTSAAYFNADSRDEVELRRLADALACRVDWHWAHAGGETINHGWKPESGFLNYCWDGYSEALVLYVLALGSPTYPVDSNCYHAWTATYQWENLYGHDFLYAGPLFVHQFSHAWIDFRGIRDRFMREKRFDYFENSRRATQIQREYAWRNPRSFAAYDENCWGFTACEGPSDDDPNLSNEPRSRFGYAARGVPYGPDDGSIAGWAPLASLPFAPEIAFRAARSMLARHPEIASGDRFASSFNPSEPDLDGRAWVSPGHFGLDQGIVAMMIENYRTELIWRLMRNCSYLVNGLKRAGFRGGWL